MKNTVEETCCLILPYSVSVPGKDKDFSENQASVFLKSMCVLDQKGCDNLCKLLLCFWTFLDEGSAPPLSVCWHLFSEPTFPLKKAPRHVERAPKWIILALSVA